MSENISPIRLLGGFPFGVVLNLGYFHDVDFGDVDWLLNNNRLLNHDLLVDRNLHWVGNLLHMGVVDGFDVIGHVDTEMGTETSNRQFLSVGIGL